MPRTKLFWILLSVFQIAFGLIVFSATRYVYTSDRGESIKVDQSPVPQSSGQMLDVDSKMWESLVDLQGDTPDPVAMSALANEYFADKDYAKAAELYERLLAFGPNNADIHNNLGLTLHYLGKSDEAIGRLEEGLALDSTNQRAWLTLGFVNSEMGNADEARVALTKAVQMNADSQIGQSAADMLERL